VGFGTVLALFSDIRFVADDLKFGIVYGKRGLVAELAVSWILPRIVGVSAAMDILMSGRHVGAQEAQAIGLASRVLPADQLFEQAFEYCREMAANCAPWAMRGMKQQVYADLANRLDESYGRSFVLLNQALKSADFAEGLKALKERRAPQFPPLPADLWSLDVFGEPGATRP
jgi:enoyl-CoA hydratase/carnithine racemase